MFHSYLLKWHRPHIHCPSCTLTYITYHTDANRSIKKYIQYGNCNLIKKLLSNTTFDRMCRICIACLKHDIHEMTIITQTKLHALHSIFMFVICPNGILVIQPTDCYRASQHFPTDMLIGYLYYLNGQKQLII